MITTVEGQTVWTFTEPTLEQITSGDYTLPVNFKVVDINTSTYKIISFVADSENGARKLELGSGNLVTKIPDYTEGETVQIGELRSYDNAIWRCEIDNNTNAPQLDTWLKLPYNNVRVVEVESYPGNIFTIQDDVLEGENIIFHALQGYSFYPNCVAMAMGDNLHDYYPHDYTINVFLDFEQSLINDEVTCSYFLKDSASIVFYYTGGYLYELQSCPATNSVATKGWKKLANLSGDVGDLISSVSESNAINSSILKANEKELEIQNLGLVENKDIYFQKLNTNEAVIYKSLGGIDWHKINLKNSTTNNSPLKIVSQKAFKIYGYILPDEAVQTGTWIAANSNDSSAYVGHKSLYIFSANNKLTFTKTFGGKLELIYVKSVDCGIMQVKIDGVSVATIDTYSSTSNQFKQVITLSEYLDYGSHTIEIINTGTKNASSSNTRVWFNALKITDSNINPTSNFIKVKEWKAGESVLQYEERIGANSKIYLATTTGTTGTVLPSHVSGTVSDGGVNWLVLSSSSFISNEFYVQLEGSELEYAYEAKPDGEVNRQDIGGNLHGNEELLSSKLIIDNEIKDFSTLTNNAFYLGKNICLQQNIKQYYGTPSSNYEIANVTTNHLFNNQCINFYADFEFKVKTQVGYFYNAMYPFVAFEGATARKVALDYATPSNQFNLINYSETIGIQTNNTKDFIAWVNGNAYVPSGVAGVPSTSLGAGKFLIALKSDSKSLKDYEYSNINLGIVPNLNNGKYSSYSSWVGKIYFQMASLESPYVFQIGEKYNINNRYYLKLY